MPAHRIVSLLPSATEIVAALGASQRLVGRSHECDFPGGLEVVPICSRPRIDPSRSSIDIDSDIKQRLANALSIFEVDQAQLSAVAPDLVITQDQCEVCAVHLDDLRLSLDETMPSSPDILSLAPRTLGDVWQSIRDVGRAAGLEEAAECLVDTLATRMGSLSESTHELAADTRPRVVCIEWLEPLMVAGNWVPELVDTAGGTDILGTAGQHSPWIESTALAEADPDHLILMPCGLDIGRTRSELAVISDQPWWNDLRAVQQGNVAITDGHQFFNRPGPRLVESAEILAEILHPTGRDWGHQGTGWQPL